MHQLSRLLPTKAPKDVYMEAKGYLLWMVWHDELNPVVAQTMQDYGGLQLSREEHQGLWFFFSTDALLAVARLESWARFNSLAVSLMIMPAALAAGSERRFSLTLAQGLNTQTSEAPESFQAWVHSDAVTNAQAVAGIRVQENTPPGLHGSWFLLQIDPRLPYKSSIGCYALLRPLGNPIDKLFQTGWRNLFAEVENILQRHKFRYTIHDFFLMFPLENLRQIKAWVSDYLGLIARLKQEAPDSYWPCALVIVDKKNLSFNNELPKKIDLDWGLLAADYPHMNFCNAMLLGEEFSIHEVRFSRGNTPEDWCNVSLSQEGDSGKKSLPLLVPGNLVLGKCPPCFYCGQRSHELPACPTHSFPVRDKDVWKQVAALDFATMKEGMRAIDAAVSPTDNSAIFTIITQDDSAGVMAKAVYDIAGSFQIRNIYRIWRTRGKIPSVSDDDLTPEDHHPIWDALANFAATDKLALEKSLNNLALRFPRDFRIRSLQGFAALERGDFQKAIHFWEEAEGMSPAGFVQSWHQFLQARAAECMSRFAQAIALYDQAAATCPSWLEPQYRRVVCMVKTGFADRAFSTLYKLMELEPHYFNRALLDPEMERGQIQILTSLGTIWGTIEAQMQDEPTILERLRMEIEAWFTPTHPFAVQAEERITRLRDLGKYTNYVPFYAAIKGRNNLERDMQQLIVRESREFRNRFKGYLAKLSHIRDEAAWFPFPRIMGDFNKNYNQCASNLNWAMVTNLNVADAFRKAQLMAVSEEERITVLERRLKLLRLIRDGTLFILTFLRTFFWLEIAGLLLVLVILPLSIYYGQKSGASWAVNTLVAQKWEVQKLATFAVSFLALGFALIRTVLRFEKIRDKVLAKARQEEQQRKAAPVKARRKR